MFISQVWDQLKISDMRFAAELTFSRSALKAELNFDLIPDLRDFIYQLKNKRNTGTLNFKPDQYI